MKNYYKLEPTPANARFLLQLSKHNVNVSLDEKILELAKQDMIEDFSKATFEVNPRTTKIVQEMIDNNMRFFVDLHNEEFLKKALSFCADKLDTKIYHLNINLIDKRTWGFPTVTVDQIMKDSFISDNRQSIIFLTFAESNGQYLSSDVFYMYERIVFCGRGSPQLDNSRLPYFNVMKPTQDCGFINSGPFAAPFLRRKIII